MSIILKNSVRKKSTITDVSKIAKNVLLDTLNFSHKKIPNDDIKLNSITDIEKEKTLSLLGLFVLYLLSKDSIHYPRYTYYDKQIRHVNKFLRHVCPDKSSEYQS